MVVAFKCFLFPSVGGYPNTDYLSILEEPTSASGVDLCFIVFEHLISGVSKFNRSWKLNGRKPKCFEFCYYALAVRYLDSLDFGARNVDQSVPRISVWKGNLIKFFSDLDHKKNNCFGKRQLKINVAHSYIQREVIGDCKCGNYSSTNDPDTCFSAGFEEALHIRFGNSLESKIIDGIIDSVKSAEVAKLHNVPKCELLVNNLLNFLVCFSPCDVKCPIPENNVSVHDQADIASHLDLVSPNVFCKSFCGNLIGSSIHRNPASPDLVSTAPGDFNTFKTAPARQPLNKVKSRLGNGLPLQQAASSLNTYPAGVKDHRSSTFMYSPISHLTLSPFSNAKESNASLVSGIKMIPTGSIETPIPVPDICSKPQLVSNVSLSRGSNLIDSGSKGAPIAVPDLSPKPQLESNALRFSENKMNVTGSKQDPIPVCDPSPKSQAIPSAEVVVTGSSSFSFRQVELSKKGDDLYNSLANNVGYQAKQPCSFKIDDDNDDGCFIDLSQDAFQVDIKKDDLVILQPKNSLCLPLCQNGRFPVSDSDIKNYCAIVDLAYTHGIQKTYVVKYPKVHCSFISLGQSLMVGGHVDNFLIPVFCRKLFEDNHPSKSGRHHFFSLVGESILDHDNDNQLAFVSKALKGAALASKKQSLELSDRLFFPICRERHWFTFSVDFKYNCFVFLDSLYNKDDYFHTSIKKRMINNFVKIWKVAFATQENMFKNFRVMYANVPKQDNPDDCGVSQ